MLAKSLFLFILSFNSIASEVCGVTLNQVFETEILNSSPFVNNRASFDDVSQELLSKGYLKDVDLEDLKAVDLEINRIEREVREQVVSELNPSGALTGRQIESRIKTEVYRRLENLDEYNDWVTQSRESRLETLQQFNLNQPSGRVIDFSSNDAFHASLNRIKSLDGVEAIDAQTLLESGKFPETIYRYDNHFHNLTNSRGLPKAHITVKPDGRKVLAPVNPNGEGSIVNHVAADNAENKAHSAFISFSDKAESVERFGNKAIKVDVRKLLQGIVDGKVKGVDVITSEQLRNGARIKLSNTLEKVGISPSNIASTLKQVSKIAKASDGHLTKEQSYKIQHLVEELTEAAHTVDKKSRDALIETLKLEVNYLRHSITNSEVLIRGSVPEEYLTIPKKID